MTEHSPEPWITDGFLKSIGWQIDDHLVIQDAEEMPVCACRDEATMQRIVACVNACAGIPIETLEKPLHWKWNDALGTSFST